VLLTAEDGREHVYLSDFGVAKSALFATGLTTAGQRVGTIDYVAPEQIRGAAVDGRADQYSLGCLLYEFLAGEVPFRRDTEVAVIYAHLRDNPQAVSNRFPEIPPGIDAVLARALAKRPRDRYETCRDLAAAAEAAVGRSRSGTGAGALTLRKHRARSLRSTLLRALVAAVLVIAFAFAIGGGGLSPSHSAGGSTARLTGMYETRISGATAEDAGLTGTWRVRFLPGGTVRAIWNGVNVVRGKMSTAGTRVTFTDVAGSEACFGPETTGVYRWALQGGRLTFTPLRDRCRPRRIVLLMHPWVKVG
jgi:Protein kinase domain